jgi:hypothetical protein
MATTIMGRTAAQAPVTARAERAPTVPHGPRDERQGRQTRRTPVGRIAADLVAVRAHQGCKHVPCRAATKPSSIRSLGAHAKAQVCLIHDCGDEIGGSGTLRLGSEMLRVVGILTWKELDLFLFAREASETCLLQHKYIMLEVSRDATAQPPPRPVPATL